VKQTSFADWAILGAPRDYDEDGVFDDEHEGLDMHGNEGDDVLACAPGRVVWASDQRRIGGDSFYGNHVIIEHDDGVITWYGHLSDILSAVGDVVERGDVIGWVGATGKATGPHLHLTVQHIGYGFAGFVVPDVVDPLDYLE
jgi:murein DD-endopeptidase MepM/ murein hydrolase activator NlpD